MTDFDPESYEWRVNNLLSLIKRQNEQQKKEDAWLGNQKFISKTKKPKKKTKSQLRKEQLQKLKSQIPELNNISKFFNF